MVGAFLSLQLDIITPITLFEEVIEVCAAKIPLPDYRPHGLHRAAFFLPHAETI